ncbi:MAG: acyl dehydratase [Propionibacterium sp.]|nr:acyl dehydratase [Propionibacterium sp.]
MSQLFFEDVTIGDEITPLVVTCDETQLFLFSAATYNAHRIHYDKTWARDEGYTDVLVQGPLQAGLLSRAVTDWIGPRGRLVSFSTQNRAVAHPGEELTFTGTVTATNELSGRIDLDLVGRRGDTVLMPGTAAVRLPKRSAG